MHLARSKWIVATTPDQEIVTPLVEALNIPEALAALLVQRGFDSIDGARTYLKPSLDTLSDPLGLKDMDKAEVV